jgi:hypothetical protein
MYSLPRMTLGDMASASAKLRKLGVGATSMEEAGQRVVRFLFENFGNPETKERGGVLVRIYRTVRFGMLPLEFTRAGDLPADARVTEDTRCLVLLASVGVERAWMSRRASVQHRLLPLPSVEAVSRLPMVARLVSQLGIDVAALVSGATALLVDDERTFNVFYVADARGSPYIPAQDFVERYGVRSVLGFGGQLSDGEIYAAILFSKVEIRPETASAFRPLALATKVALLPFVGGRVFEEALDVPLID